MSIQTFLGLISLLLTIAAYTAYLHDTFRKGVRPHAIAWAAFGLFTCVGYLVQVRKGAGPGGWALGLTSASCFVISGASLWKQFQEDEEWWRFPRIDWIWLGISVVIFWFYLRFPSQSTMAAILATLADLAAYGPIINQGWRDPYKDCVKAFVLNCAKFVPALLALRVYSVATTLYPAAVLVMNAFVAWLLAHRRAHLAEMASAAKKATP